jgi:hypothetical protein
LVGDDRLIVVGDSTGTLSALRALSASSTLIALGTSSTLIALGTSSTLSAGRTLSARSTLRALRTSRAGSTSALVSERSPCRRAGADLEFRRVGLEAEFTGGERRIR